MLSLFSACWYFLALTRFVFSDPRGNIFGVAARDLSLQSSSKLFVFLFVYFFMLSLFSACWYFLALTRFVFSDPRGNFFGVAARDLSQQSSSKPFVFLSVYFFMLSLFSACWYFLALALCSLSVLAKLCVPEKSSFAHI